MNVATEFDAGPLSWVKSEIDLALERAVQSLDLYGADRDSGAGDATQIRFCRTHLHQVHGALTIVGLDGVTQFTEAVEAMLEQVEQGRCPDPAAAIGLAGKALAAIGQYLAGLVDGQPDQPLRLLPLYREVQAMRGLPRVAAADLFFPDLSVRPPRRTAPARQLSADDLLKILRQERARFQRGLLAWLRAPLDRGGVKEMLTAVACIEETQESDAARAFWWVAAAFLAGLADGALSEEPSSKQLCARIDLQIRRLLEGSRNVAERLMRDALYLVAGAPGDSPVLAQVRQAYRLDSLLPREERALVAPAEDVLALGKLREVITALEESWSKFCAGAAASDLAGFRDNARTLAADVAQLGHTDFRRLAQAIAAAANWLAEDARRQSEALAMEIATAILLSQNARENFHRLGGDFAHQVDVTVARIHACIAGKPPAPGSEVPLLDEMSRLAQEKLLVAQVVREIQSNLAQVEQVLDSFFRDPEKRADLASLEVPFRQVAGALNMLRKDSALAALQQCQAEVRRFADPGHQVAESDFVDVADQLSMLGFFIEAMPRGADDYAAFVKQMRSPRPVQEAATEAHGASVEQEIERNKLQAHALLGELCEKPGDAGLREAVRNSLKALKNDADLVADVTLGEQVKAMLNSLERGADRPQLEQMMGVLKPEAPAVAAPSAEAVQLAQASRDDVDAELLGIFLEEANEVLASIAANLHGLRTHGHDTDGLTTIRRSFHTLKGSGRMVGLKDVGEAAWAMEQTLNFWLRQELPATPALLELIEQAQAVFDAWVRHLEWQVGEVPDPAPMMARAEALRSGQAGAVVSVPPEVVEEPVQEKAPGQEEGVAVLPVAPLVVETGMEEESPVRSAEIIRVDFGALQAPAPEHEAEEGQSLEAGSSRAGAEMDIPSDDSAAPELPVSTPDAGVPSEPVEALPMTSPTRQQRIVISPVLFEIFSEEARAHLQTLWRELPLLECAELQPTPHDMYRAAHTLAGISATVGLFPINQLGYALEHALLRRDHSEQPGSLQALGVIKRAIAELELMLSAAAGQDGLAVPAGLIEELDELYPANLAALPTSLAAQDEDAAQPGGAVVPSPAVPARSDGRADAAGETGLSSAMPLPRDDIDEQLLPIFLEEAVDLDQGIAAQLRAWRADPGNDETVRTLERLLHTLKGSARMAGAMCLGEMTHALETRVDQISRAGNVGAETIEEIDNAFDAIRQVIDGLQRGETSGELPGEMAAEVPVAEQAEVVAPVTPVFEERRTDRSRLGRAEPDAEAEASPAQATLRVRAGLIDRLVNDAGELSIARSRIEGEMRGLKESLLDLTENVIRLRRQLREIEIQAESQMQSRTAMADERHAGFDPLEFDRFTRFQELTRMMAESVNDVATVQQSLLKNLDDANAAIIAQARLNREVQQTLLSVRMVPFSSLADRLYRIVRQTAKELDKRANLDIRGGQVELDRNVLDKIAAPLEHMLRNAVAHGLEGREERLAQGKPEVGEISLALKQEGNEVVLVLADDGRGLDYARIRARAQAVGLLATEESPAPEKLAELIFAPGFSTADAVSRIAGRGVGMDVVKTEVNNLGGRIEIASTPGQGAEFRLIIPLTLAVTKALLIRVGSKTYAIPSSMIEQVLDLKEDALERIRQAGNAEWMGSIYPFDHLPHMLGDPLAQPELRRQYWVLLLRSGARRIAVQVDELLGNEEIVVKNIGAQLARVIGIDGATVLGNGQVVLILNPVALSTRPRVAAAATEAVPGQADSAGAQAPVPAGALPTVMVVDDSLTVRKITGRLLAREGYQVLIAKDGVEALEQLLDVVPDVMLVDIEMPRMDGFDLTRNVRADARLKHVPIIMITSRTADKHRNYAFEIGVNHYLGKPYQEEELLRLVAAYVAERRAIS